MEEETRVTLHGMWASTYSKRVELALRVKGIPYEYVEEDLSNKSELLLKYNPVHKKIPVLVYNGKSISESPVILEYIDETWKNAPRLLPENPYKRAKVRFWASFLQQQVFESMGKVVTSHGEAQEKGTKEVFEKLKVLEEGIKELYPEGLPLIAGQSLGLLDVLICATFSTHKTFEEAIGVRILDPERNPLICSWVAILNEMPVVKELQPPHDKLVVLLQAIRQNSHSTHKAIMCNVS